MLPPISFLILGASISLIRTVEMQPYTTFEETHRINPEFGMPKHNATTVVPAALHNNVFREPDYPNGQPLPMQYRSMPALFDPASTGETHVNHSRKLPGLAQPATFIHTGENLNITAERVQAEEAAAANTTPSPCGPDVHPDDCIDDNLDVTNSTESIPETTTPFEPVNEPEFLKLLIGRDLENSTDTRG
ncbi:uncharacterized protein LOC129592715 [Paramacrobiotus metropolitanus]|uniref:uncharacterized protein LOC129592715 n=1 Tax=Paramacrobiotus metropolitanus TaxID=2943436 RepID=UPI002445FD24|nr:uncharacterized protein LOC129592715 [Paramacrobiotus metropolitanus]